MKPVGLFVCLALLALTGVPGKGQPQNASETRQEGDLVTFWKTAVAASRAEGDGAREIASLRSLGEAYERLGRCDEGLETLEVCLQRATALGVSQAGALASTGRLYSVLGDHRNALDHLQRAAAMHRAEGDTTSEIAARLSIAAEYTSLGDVQKALDTYRAVTLARADGPARNRVAEAFRLGGKLLADLGKYRQALEWLGRGLSRYADSGRGRALILCDMGSVYGRLNRRALALQRLDESLRAMPPDEKAPDVVTLDFLTDAGVAYSVAGEHRKAIDCFARGAAAAAAEGRLEQQANFLALTAQAERARGRLETALDRIREALAVRESIRGRLHSPSQRAAYFASVRSFYDLQVQVLAELDAKHPGTGFNVAAFETSERARARALLDVLSEASTADGRAIDGPALMEAPALTLDQIRRTVLDDDTVLLEYMLCEEKSHLWAVGKDLFAHLDLPGRPAIERLAKDVYEAWARGPEARDYWMRNRTPKTAMQLSRLVLGPLAGVLRGKRVLLVADGWLRYVPFPALPDPEYRRRRLVAGHDVVHVPSASVLASIRQRDGDRQALTQDVAILADPVFERNDPRLREARRTADVVGPSDPTTGSVENLPRPAGAATIPGVPARLMFSRREADAILSLVPAGRALKEVDFNASRAAAMSPDLAHYRIVHFATHSILDDEHPNLTGLVLSLYDERGRSQDGFLRLGDIYSLRLPVDLVVLSACRTALGKDVKGEGVVGLTYGFMSAGAARVVASLWKVDDAATAELMTRFYEGMLRKGLAPAAALRAAQISLAKTVKWGDPYYWAGFVLEGEWN